MADSGLFIGFGAPVRGRERQATKVFTEAFEYYSRLQQEGEIESFEPVLLEAHGGELDGFFLLRGDQDKLARIRSSEEFERLTVRAQLIVENLGIVGAALGGGSCPSWPCSARRWKNLPSGPESLIHADQISAGDAARGRPVRCGRPTSRQIAGQLMLARPGQSRHPSPRSWMLHAPQRSRHSARPSGGTARSER